MATPKPYKSIRVFENPWLERLTHVHPITPLLFWTPVISFLLWRSSAVHGISIFGILAIAPFGLLVWTLTEYLLHRFVFHFPAESKFGERLVYLIHGLHHSDPIDPTRLVMPPFPGVVIASILFFIFRLFLGPVYIEPFFGFFLLGYLWYDYTHYAVHHFTPRTRVGKYLKQHHMLHHYATPELRMGISTPLWDYVFGTLRPEKKEQTV